MSKLPNFLLFLVAALAPHYSAADDNSYFPCRSCHGDDGWGSPAIHAPAIAGLSENYILRQLTNYRDGIRGSHQDDTYGRQMALMAQNLDDGGIQKLSAFVSEMAPRPRTGNTHSTEYTAVYQSCVVCHGSLGEGNEALNAPRISGLDMIYLSTQLRHFRSGARGADAIGQQMRATATTLTDEQIEQLAQLISSM